ncbi:TonB family protein [Bradyrhizobium sp. STM 3562]|uniref:TonB family protein n=1 Tax=Bradyrhizobium sp. STM 3562 TaxID=578924 RepID=UPI00388E82D2
MCGEAPRGEFAFDLPSQPLGAALEGYARISGREVLYDGRLAEGRRSSPVQGAYTAETALQILLAGSGLKADAKADGFFVLSRVPARSAAERGLRLSAADTHYYGVLQAGLRAELCGSHALPETGRIAARLWLSQTGAVLQARLLGSTGNSEWDQRAIAALRRLQIAGPPPGFAQPVTIVVLPRPSDGDDGCAAQRQSPTRAGR